MFENAWNLNNSKRAVTGKVCENTQQNGRARLCHWSAYVGPGAGSSESCEYNMNKKITFEQKNELKA